MGLARHGRQFIHQEVPHAPARRHGMSPRYTDERLPGAALPARGGGGGRGQPAPGPGVAGPGFGRGRGREPGRADGRGRITLCDSLRPQPGCGLLGAGREGAEAPADPQPAAAGGQGSLDTGGGGHRQPGPGTHGAVPGGRRLPRLPAGDAPAGPGPRQGRSPAGRRRPAGAADAPPRAGRAPRLSRAGPGGGSSGREGHGSEPPAAGHGRRPVSRAVVAGPHSTGAGGPAASPREGDLLRPRRERPPLARPGPGHGRRRAPGGKPLLGSPPGRLGEGVDGPDPAHGGRHPGRRGGACPVLSAAPRPGHLKGARRLRPPGLRPGAVYLPGAGLQAPR